MRVMRIQSLAIILLGTLVVATGAVHAQSASPSGKYFSSLEERMSQADFNRAGLNKLSAEQLKFLDQWLTRHVGKIHSSPVQAGAPNNFGNRRAVTQPRKKLESRIVGSFSGWSGNTQIKLANGQVWQQIGSESWMCQTVQNPKVTIKPMILGSWLIYVQGCGQSVRVQPVR